MMVADFEHGEIADDADHKELFKELPLHRIGAGAVFEGLDFADEFPDVFELPVDRDVTNIGHGIDFVELVHDLGTDTAGWDFGMVITVEFGEYFIDGAVDALHGNFALLAGLDEAPEELLTIHGFAAAVFFDDPELGALDLLVGGETGAAVETFATTSDRSTILGTPGVDDFVLMGPALDTTHSFLAKLGADSAEEAGFGRKNLPAHWKSFTRSTNLGIGSVNLKK